MDTPDLVTGSVGALAGAIATGLLGWLTKRTEKTLEIDAKRAERAPDQQESINAAVAGVVRHYAEALTRSDAEIAERRAEAQALRAEVAELRRLVEAQTERLEEQSIKIADQSAEIDGLIGHITRLEQAFTAAGLSPPARRKRPASPSERGCA